ncbi:MAG: PD-(D/E)XK nuclease family protein, partial [Myxococcota bacterium]
MIETWLAAHPPSEPVLVVAASPEAASEGLRRELADPAVGATFGRHRTTLPHLAAELAEARLAAAGRVAAGRLATLAVAARAVAREAAAGGLGRLAAVAETPGFVRAVSSTLEELRLARQTPPAFLEPLAHTYDDELQHAGLADLAAVFTVATEEVADSDHRLVGLPTFLLEFSVDHVAAGEFVAALA